jgi:hypothetical protein
MPIVASAAATARSAEAMSGRRWRISDRNSVGTLGTVGLQGELGSEKLLAGSPISTAIAFS